MEKDVEIGIFGGTGIYDSGLLENAQEIEVDTPYGKPSDTITVGSFKGRKLHSFQDMEKNIQFLHI